MMNARERFRKTILFDYPDRIPLFLTPVGTFRHATARRWAREGLAGMLSKEYDFEDSYPAEMHQEIIKLFEVEAGEMLPVKAGMIPSFESVILEETDNYKIWIDDMGIKRKDFKKDRNPGFVTRSYLEFPVKNEMGFHSMERRFNPYDSRRFPENWDDQIVKYREREFLLKWHVPGFFWQIRDWLGFENTCTGFYDNPSFMMEMMEFWADYLINLFTLVLKDIELDYILLNEDMAYKHASMISPQMVREFMVPNYRKVIDHLRSKGQEIILIDSDGDVSELIPIWIDLGINGTMPVEIAAGMDPVAVRKKYGKHMAMIGGLDKRELAKDIQNIDAELDAKLPYLLAQGGFIPTVDHGMPADVPFRNFLHYAERIKKYSRCEYWPDLAIAERNVSL
jgi:hypothetical protein